MPEITATIDDIDRWDAHEILDVIGGEFDDLTWAFGSARLIISGDEGRVRQALKSSCASTAIRTPRSRIADAP